MSIEQDGAAARGTADAVGGDPLVARPGVR
jgi:hypothetical protein